MATIIESSRAVKRFPALSVKDLLMAREAYHVHLTRMPHVGRDRDRALSKESGGPKSPATPTRSRGS
jgi:hypothetical protein